MLAPSFESLIIFVVEAEPGKVYVLCLLIRLVFITRYESCISSNQYKAKHRTQVNYGKNPSPHHVM